MLLTLMAGECQGNVQLHFYYTTALSQLLPILQNLWSVSFHLLLISLWWSLCTSTVSQFNYLLVPLSFIRQLLDLFYTPTFYFDMSDGPFSSIEVTPMLMQAVLKVLLRTSLWLNTARSAISKWHPRNIFSGILGYHHADLRYFLQTFVIFPSYVYLKHQVLSFSNLPSYLLSLPEGKARTLNFDSCLLPSNSFGVTARTTPFAFF